MALLRDVNSEVRNLAEQYVRQVLEAATWTAVELPEGTRVIEASSNNVVICREATDDILPAEAPGATGGAGSVLVSLFDVNSDTTYLLLYSTGGDTVYLNCYTA